MKLLRVFPRKTKCTPTDENVRIAVTPSFFDEADEIHISVTFTYDMKLAEHLYKAWSYVAPTKIDGVAFKGHVQGEFEPGKYLKKGIVITSRGCPNKCWFCGVWKRDNVIKELPIKDGFNLMDDNILACSESHIEQVFAMLKRQKEKPIFSGGLDSRYITPKIASMLYDLKPERMYFANDTPDDLEPLFQAGRILRENGFKELEHSHILSCYILMGYSSDSIEEASKRVWQTIEAGFMPFAMLYRDQKGEVKKEWKQFQREWANPFIVASNMKSGKYKPKKVK